MRVAHKFEFKQFTVHHDRSTMKVGTDGVLLGAWADVTNATRILDVGTGSGVIALMLAQRLNSEIQIDAIDISQDACEQACENISQSPWPKKISVTHTPLQEFDGQPYDLIISNPPFFSNSYKPPSSGRIVARHTETLTHSELLTHSKRLLQPTGRLNVVLPEAEANRLKTLAENNNWYCTRKCIFRSRISKPPERILMEFKLEAAPINLQELILYENDQEWSEGYRALTKDFYLKL
jgi:tRNA1Val (adenine37-N6)-methyltransferase